MTYGLYIHVPFCTSKCNYCDFYSRPGASGVPDEYIGAVLRVFSLHAPREASGAAMRPATVYFGGGTPGLLAPGQVARVLSVVRPAEGAEITLEVNPCSATDEKLAGYFAAGVNRLSVGVQTARDASLARLGRRHTAAQAAATLAAARAAGFDNVSADIMLGLPGYTCAEFDDALRLAAENGASHVSAYLLKIEPGTPFGKNLPDGLPDAEEAAGFYLYAVERLAGAGFAQYEISNFAKAGCHSRHNLLYWDCGEYLGLGPAAHSCLCGRRFSFAPDLQAFLGGAALQAGPLCRDEGEADAGDYMMLRLRLAEGLDFALLKSRFDTELSQKQLALLQRLETEGLCVLTPRNVCLTPQGMLVQNTILSSLL